MSERLAAVLDELPFAIAQATAYIRMSHLCWVVVEETSECSRFLMQQQLCAVAQATTRIHIE